MCRAAFDANGGQDGTGLLSREDFAEALKMALLENNLTDEEVDVQRRSLSHLRETTTFPRKLVRVLRKR